MTNRVLPLLLAIAVTAVGGPALAQSNRYVTPAGSCSRPI